MTRLLVVKLGAIGDVLRTTSLLPGLKAKYPLAEIDWLTASNAKELLFNNPLIKNIFTWEERGELNGYDLVIGLEDELEVCDFVSSLRPGEIVGAYSQNGRQTYTPSGWFDMSMISKYGLDEANNLKKNNQKTYQEHMAELLGIKISPYVFNLTDDEINYGKKVVETLGLKYWKNIIGINTGAGKRWPQKSWGVESTIELVKRLDRELGLKSLIMGGVEEKQRNQHIARETGMPDIGSHSLRGFASIINQCALILTSDSLAMHFAIALKKKVMVFFGPTSAAEIELYGFGEKIVPDKDCLVCYKKNCQINPNCMELLTVEAVYQRLKRLSST